MALEVRKKCTDTKFVVLVRNVWTGTDLPTKGKKIVRIELKNTKKIKTKTKIYMSIEVKKQVLRDVYRL